MKIRVSVLSMSHKILSIISDQLLMAFSFIYANIPCKPRQGCKKFSSTPPPPLGSIKPLGKRGRGKEEGRRKGDGKREERVRSEEGKRI